MSGASAAGRCPRVLLVSHNVLGGSTAMGKTMASLLANAPADHLAQVYFHSEVPTSDACSTYFRITDVDVLHSIFGRGRAGHEVAAAERRMGEVRSRTDKGALAHVYQLGRRRTPLTYAARGALWRMGHIDEEALLRWARAFAPDVILFAAVTKKNCGVIALVAAYVFGIFVLKMKPAEIYAKGWPMGVFFIALSTTFLFAIANVNGTIEAMAKNIAYFAHGSAKLLPVVFFIGGAIISGIGAGGLVIAVIAPIALYVAVQNKIPVLMMSLVTMGGIMAGGLSPVAINGLVANRIAMAQNIPGYTYIRYPAWRTPKRRRGRRSTAGRS